MQWNKALTKIRKEKGYSQQQIADHFFTTQQQYSKYETNQQEMTVTRILDLCKLFNVSADQLLGINYYENEEGRTMSKYEELKEMVFEIIRYAKEQHFIDTYGQNALEEIFYKEIEKLDMK